MTSSYETNALRLRALFAEADEMRNEFASLHRRYDAMWTAQAINAAQELGMSECSLRAACDTLGAERWRTIFDPLCKVVNAAHNETTEMMTCISVDVVTLCEAMKAQDSERFVKEYEKQARNFGYPFLDYVKGPWE